MPEKTKVDMIYDLAKENNKLLIEDIKQTTTNKTDIAFIKKLIFMIIAPVFTIASIVSMIAAFTG
jgi:glycosylphosphatidylinositol transamidase (GPIT) subunit GPI8